MPAVASHDQVCTYAELTLWRSHSYTDDATLLLDEVSRFRSHVQVESLVTAALLRDEVQEVPLRHECDVLAVRRQMAKVDHPDTLTADLGAEVLHLAVRQGEKFVQQPELEHQFQCRGVNRVAAEITQEVRVLLQHCDADASAREEKSEHHPGGTATDDATLPGNGRGAHVRIYHPMKGEIH